MTPMPMLLVFYLPVVMCARLWTFLPVVVQEYRLQPLNRLVFEVKPIIEFSALPRRGQVPRTQRNAVHRFEQTVRLNRLTARLVTAMLEVEVRVPPMSVLTWLNPVTVRLTMPRIMVLPLRLVEMLVVMGSMSMWHLVLSDLPVVLSPVMPWFATMRPVFLPVNVTLTLQLTDLVSLLPSAVPLFLAMTMAPLANRFTGLLPSVGLKCTRAAC